MAKALVETQLRETTAYQDRLVEMWSRAYNRKTGKVLNFIEGIEDPHKQRFAAVMLENMRRYFESLSEDTRLINVGTFDKWASTQGAPGKLGELLES